LYSFDITDLQKNEINFSYRNSIFKKTEQFFIISSKFDLSEKNEKYTSDVDNIDFRENKQPK
jgi:UDP-N-acetylenolpyruvoylglucosamine reductase